MVGFQEDESVWRIGSFHGDESVRRISFEIYELGENLYGKIDKIRVAYRYTN